MIVVVIVMGEVGRGLPRGGVLLDEALEQRGESRLRGWVRRGVGRGFHVWRKASPCPRGVADLVEREQWTQRSPGSGIHQLHRAQIPLRVAQVQGLELPVPGRHFEAHGFEAKGAIAPALSSRDLAAEGMTQGLCVRGIAPTPLASRKRRSGEVPISRCGSLL